jgi:hypothetical protein
MKGNEYKKHDRDTCAWDLNAGCRAFTANTKSRRKLRKRLRKALRKKIERAEKYDD